jgi:hypothetical protein
MGVDLATRSLQTQCLNHSKCQTVTRTQALAQAGFVTPSPPLCYAYCVVSLLTCDVGRVS